ncbi:MAG: hypothetical protein J1F04_02205 [Oscillospiraceae bacterium]|nr:hypothetical protein [Oscillospiraceae bacterium]
MTGKEIKIFTGGNHVCIKNNSPEAVYASAKPDINPDAEEGVLPIMAEESAVLPDCKGTVYILGTGPIVLIGTDDIRNFFKPAVGGNSGGDSKVLSKAYVDNGDSATLESGRTYADNKDAAHNNDESAHAFIQNKIYAFQSQIINPNLLINPDFRINQRGQSAYTGPCYTADRWYKNSAGTITVEGDKIILSGESALIRQPIENENDFAGHVMTLSALVNGEVKTGTFTYPEPSQTGFTFYNDTVFRITRYTDALYIPWIVFSPVVAGETIEIEWVKLEFGDKATPFIHPDPATELLKCQKYYQLRSTGNVPDVDLRPSMRITPTSKANGSSYSYDAEIYS